MIRRHFLRFLPLAPLALLRRKGGVKHLEMFNGMIQCTGCLWQQQWRAEGEFGHYRSFIDEWHKEGCPFESRNETKVYKEDLACCVAPS